MYIRNMLKNQSILFKHFVIRPQMVVHVKLFSSNSRYEVTIITGNILQKLFKLRERIQDKKVEGKAYFTISPSSTKYTLRSNKKK